MSDGGGSAADGALNRPVFAVVICVIFGLWCLGCCSSSRCCGMWGRPSREERDLRLARLLQDEVLRGARTPQAIEYAARERERKAIVRREFVDRTLPRETFGRKDERLDGSAQQCAICLADFKDGECIARATTEACTHMYHRDCIADWLLRKSICPVCREVFLLEDVGSKMSNDSEDGEEVDSSAESSDEGQRHRHQSNGSVERATSMQQSNNGLVETACDEEQAISPEETVQTAASGLVVAPGDQENQTASS